MEPTYPQMINSASKAVTRVSGSALPCFDMRAGNRPLLFLDVDGPLIPIGGHHDAVDDRPGHRLTPALARALASNPLLYRLDPRRGRWLAALPCELVWATTWMADANEVIGPLLGLPELPIVSGRRTPTTTNPGSCTGRPGVWSTGPPDAAPSGSTTRSPTPTDAGSTPTTPRRLCFTTLIRAAGSPATTSTPSTVG